LVGVDELDATDALGGTGQLRQVRLAAAATPSRPPDRRSRPATAPARVVRQISETDVDTNVVLVFKVIGHGKTSLVFALTRGDTSSKAVKAVTHKILSR
jgi:hypothetical protein